METGVRRAVVVCWVFLTLLISLLPPWDICWHRGGALCTELQRTGCGGGQDPAPAPVDDSCSDCIDFPVASAI